MCKIGMADGANHEVRWDDGSTTATWDDSLTPLKFFYYLVDIQKLHAMHPLISSPIYSTRPTYIPPSKPSENVSRSDSNR